MAQEVMASELDEDKEHRAEDTDKVVREVG